MATQKQYEAITKAIIEALEALYILDLKVQQRGTSHRILRSDYKLALSAASKAQKAVDLILEVRKYNKNYEHTPL